MNLDEIKELLELFNTSGVGELEVERKDIRVRIRRALPVREHAPPPAHVAPVHHVGAPPVPAEPAPPVGRSAPPPTKSAESDPGDVLVKSPIVGTFYASPSPEAPAFVKVGDQVDQGQVLCIIESMKLMNEIEAEVAGTITARLVENGKPVEYGEALFSIRPR
jgi:acetyl-CoA carboxylase biotin carboxyl carrier protein